MREQRDYYQLATELRDIVEPEENRHGIVQDLIDIISQNPTRYPHLDETFDFGSSKNKREKAYFTILLQLTGIDIHGYTQEDDSRSRRYSVPDSFFSRDHRTYQSGVAHMPLPFTQPLFVREITDIIKTFFSRQAEIINLDKIMDQIDYRWPCVREDIRKQNMRTVMHIMTNMGLMKWSVSSQNKVYILPKGWWSQ